jgi:glycosyltransferase involved in cell wall biosynthesis
MDDHDHGGDQTGMKFVVAHTGARRGYAVPAIIEQAGLLECFFTDFCADKGLGRLVSSLSGLRKFSPGIAKIAARRLPKNIVAKTRTFDWPNFKHLFLRKGAGWGDDYRAYLYWQRDLSEAMVRHGFGDANWFHAFLDEFPPLISAAKRNGLGVISEIYILLSSDRLMREERKRFPGWEEEPPDFDRIYKEVFGDSVLFASGDYLLCPSEAVLNDAVENFQFRRDRCFLVPYGVSGTWFGVNNHPARGRILFAGTAELRKGIHYLAMAAEMLLARGLNYEFRIAGNVQPSIANQNECRHLTFLGRVPRDKIAAEFAAADVFVLPSLAEGSAGATYEALGAGVPVITTPAAGSIVRNEIEGRIVRERDPYALADAITELVENRDKRDRMAQAARVRAQDFTWEKYGERLIAALRKLPVST